MASNDITIQTTTGTNTATDLYGGGSNVTNGDIHVNDAVSWSANKTLTLTADGNININQNITASGATGKLVLQYGQGAVAANNTATYTIASGKKVTLAAGQNFDTKLGSDGTVVNWTVITQLGSEGDEAQAGATNSLQGLAHSSRLAGNFVLGADIDASSTSSWNTSTGFSPIGRYTGGAWFQTGQAFIGKFDGLGHTIADLRILRPNAFSATNTFIGLFGQAANAELSNIRLTGAQVSGFFAVGALAGSISLTSIKDVQVEGSVSGKAEIGGVVGQGDRISITGAIADVSVSASLNTVGDTAGGVIGYANTAVISNSHTSGTVFGRRGIAGGLAGDLEDGSSVSNSYSTATVTSNTGASYTGGLVGLIELNTQISDSYATGQVTGYDYVGGLVGSTYSYSAAGSQISNSYATGVVSGNTNVGGLVGLGQSLVLQQSYHTTGAVSGVSQVGGLVGGSDGGLQISDSYATSSVTATAGSAGGLLGYIDNGVTDRSIVDSYATGNVDSGTGAEAGGLVGGGYVNINRSYATGTVQGASKVGGLIGAAYLDSSEQIQESFATGSVSSAGNRVGGLAGVSEVTMTNVFAAGSVSGASEVGGLIGKLDEGLVTNAYSTGSVTGASLAGGLIGTGTGTVSDSYWNVTTSGLGTSGLTTGSQGGIGKTTTELKDIQTTSTWDIVTDSSMSNVYPKLRWATFGLTAGSSVWVIGPASSGGDTGEREQIIATAQNTAAERPIVFINPVTQRTFTDANGLRPNVVVTPPALSASFGPGTPLTVLSAPDGNEPSQAVSLSEAQEMVASPAPGGAAAGGDREVRVPVSRNTLAEIVNGGVKLPQGVEQLLFVVKAN